MYKLSKVYSLFIMEFCDNGKFLLLNRPVDRVGDIF